MHANQSFFDWSAFFYFFCLPIELCVILAIILNLICKLIPRNAPILTKLISSVLFGAGMGLIFSIVANIVLSAMVSESTTSIWLGIFDLTTGTILTILAFWILTVKENHVKYISPDLDYQESQFSLLNENDQVKESIKSVAKPNLIFIVIFLFVARTIFAAITGVGSTKSISFSLVGCVFGLVIGYYVYQQSTRMDMGIFLRISFWFLLVFSAGLVANSAHEFETFGYKSVGLARQAYLNNTLPPTIIPLLASGAPGVARSHHMTHRVLKSRDFVPASPPKREIRADPSCPHTTTSTGTCKVRQYFIAAEENEWDYAPSGYDHFMGVPFVRDPEGAGLYTLHSIDERRIGSVFTKALYYEYTDETFSFCKGKANWMGMLGPIIRAEVGDLIKIKFKNMASFPYSMHPHGVFYNATSEGALSQIHQIGAQIQPNTTYDYEWGVPERAGPGPADGTSVLWGYHSHYHEIQDVYSGLVGPILIYTPGTLNLTTDTPTDVDREYVLLLTVTDEMSSNYIDINIQQKLGIQDSDAIEALLASEEFREPNLKHNVNGRLFNNLDGLVANLNESVTWHAMSMGTEIDIHTLHFHGLTALEAGRRTDVVELFPASFKTIRMAKSDLVSPGTWLIHCHVGDHIKAGMISSFHIFENETDIEPKWSEKHSENEYIYGVTKFPTSSLMLWDASACCSENSNPIFAILNMISGWRAQATIVGVSAYMGYWIFVMTAMYIRVWVMTKNEEDLRRRERIASAL
ncbi:hephaestin-like 1 [Nowakowskiella sp. JEL0078]|nr:hephaestin-like 1 [Nowakowskiella sp. JEL0078]